MNTAGETSSPVDLSLCDDNRRTKRSDCFDFHRNFYPGSSKSVWHLCRLPCFCKFVHRSSVTRFKEMLLVKEKSLCYVWQTFEDFKHEKEAAGLLNDCISHRQGLTLPTDLSENWLKSASRSHIRRPLRAAFAEYTGPIPFFVVPRLVGQQDRTEEQDGEKSWR